MSKLPGCMMPDGATPCLEYQELQSRITQLEKLLGNHKDGDICPACATEFESGTFTACGGKIIKEVVSLRAERDAYREALEKCHEELVGYLRHEGGNLGDALARSDKVLAKFKTDV